MKKLIKGIFAALLMLLVVFISKPTTIFADTETLLKDKTNKLTLGDSLEESSIKIEESLATGKSLTYKIEVPKGTLYIELNDKTSYTVEIYNSKNKVVKRIKSVDILGGAAHQVKYGVALSKGKYKIKITPKNKDSALNINGTVAMIKNNTSRTIVVDKEYSTAVTKGKTYKFKFELKGKTLFGILNKITSYDPNDFFRLDTEYIIVNSAGKTVRKIDRNNDTNSTTLNKGTYTIILKADDTGILSTKINEASGEDMDRLFDFNFGN